MGDPFDPPPPLDVRGLTVIIIIIIIIIITAIVMIIILIIKRTNSYPGEVKMGSVLPG